LALTGEMAEQARSKRNRNRLVNAAAELFWRAGYDGASLADIAAEAGVPIGNVYYYFRSKAALADAVARLMDSETRAALSDINSAHPGPEQRLAALLALFSSSNAARTERGCPIARASRDFRNDAPDAAERAGRILGRIGDWLAEQFQAKLSSEEARGRARQWLMIWQGAITLAHAGNDRSVLDEAMADLNRQIAAIFA
jgi:AcrR family transcriptional regulator